MRRALSTCIAQASKKDDFLLLTGDHGYALFDELRKTSPDKFINVGIMEQAVVSTAAGLARVGFRPLCYGLASFIVLRAFEQIKFDVVLPQLPVKIMGDGAGLIYTTLGNSHQCAEDLSLLGTLPGLEIYTPGDAYEMKACFHDFYASDRPAYLRIGKDDLGEIHSKDLSNTDPQWIYEGSNSICFVSIGPMANTSLKLAREFKGSAVTIPQLKPGPWEDQVFMDRILQFQTIISLEEHVTHGGLASYLSSLLVNGPTKLFSFGLNSSFTETVGDYQHALSQHFLRFEDLKKSIAQII